MIVERRTRHHAMPPPAGVERRRAAADGRRTARLQSPTAFVTGVVPAAIAAVLAATLLAVAPPTVTIPLATVLVAGLALGGLLGLWDTLRAGRRRRRPVVWTGTERRRPWLRRPPDGRRLDGRGRGVPLGVGPWAVLGAVSLALLVLALVVPENLGGALAATGLVGLVVLRLAAMHGGWARHESAPRDSHMTLSRAAPGDAVDGRRSGPANRGHASAVYVSADLQSVWSSSLRATDRVDAAAADSFPASDPPSWTGMLAGGPRRAGLPSPVPEGPASFGTRACGRL